MDPRVQKIHGLISSTVYHQTVKATEGAEHRGEYNGNGHHWAQEISEKVADAIVSRYLEVFPFWLEGQHSHEVWRVVSSAVTPSVHRRVRNGSFSRTNHAIWILILIDHIRNDIFTRSKDIQRAVAELLKCFEADDPFSDPSLAENREKALQNYQCPAK